ncbi:hypothetical protein BCR37DRAFT_386256 [Protomyces lactucae-debilis]|uniref:Uncharacterized protein n=1 Tax=Protomyces lactucae-debilis TaxID=2754530 RepID=A0A1Y2FLU0_PROLT|nr:uncharacterized protein BCR37DRAFT_386256 [Protomyces lactucae-debilis]ORY84899.1 hypothetical protein BCR37DRAFT_386256 [Protomyces lactucae-debilis]
MLTCNSLAGLIGTACSHYFAACSDAVLLIANIVLDNQSDVVCTVDNDTIHHVTNHIASFGQLTRDIGPDNLILGDDSKPDPLDSGPIALRVPKGQHSDLKDFIYVPIFTQDIQTAPFQRVDIFLNERRGLASQRDSLCE